MIHTGAVPSQPTAWKRGSAGHPTRLRSVILAGIFCGLTIYFKPSGAPCCCRGWRSSSSCCLERWAEARPAVTCGDGRWLRSSRSSPCSPTLQPTAHSADLYQTVIVFNTYHARIGGNPTLAGIATGTLDFLTSMNILAPLALAGTLGHVAVSSWPTGHMPPAQGAFSPAA